MIVSAIDKPPETEVLYKLAELIAAPLTTRVYVCSGEVEAEHLAKLGFLTTSLRDGASVPWAELARAITAEALTRPRVCGLIGCKAIPSILIDHAFSGVVER